MLADRPDALWLLDDPLWPTSPLARPITPLAESGLTRISISDFGSVNLGHRQGGVLRGSFVYANTFEAIVDVRHTNQRCPSIAIYEPGFLRAILAHRAAGT